jgi:hypothetical protein
MDENEDENALNDPINLAEIDTNEDEGDEDENEYLYTVEGKKT